MSRSGSGAEYERGLFDSEGQGTPASRPGVAAGPAAGRLLADGGKGPRIRAGGVGGASDGALERARRIAQGGLAQAARRAWPGAPTFAPGGKLLRPVVAYAGIARDARTRVGTRFWHGALAIQMVHEASLLHDDIVDDADRRRGASALHAEAGVARALIQGDHVLTAAYRMALLAESPDFLELFIRAVERTVAGELAQGRSTGRRPSDDEYMHFLAGKSGELFGCALALAPCLGLGGRGSLQAELRVAVRLGREIGVLYQMVDDFLDFCAGARSGKPPLQDYRQGKWTWPLGFSEVDDFRRPPDELGPALFDPPSSGGESPMRQALARLRRQMEGMERAIALHLQDDGLLNALLRSWTMEAEESLEREEAARSAGSVKGSPGRSTVIASVLADAAALGDEGAQRAFFSKHSRTFHFASFLFPPEARKVVAGLYAFCRFTDDLVDEGGERTASERGQRLDAWLEIIRASHRGDASGIAFLDELMERTVERGVPIRYAEALIEGVRMDLRPARYYSIEELREYTRRVASVIGQWMTGLFGTPSLATLAGAEELGHAMQLTNILRDVGEDARMGRIYLPADRMSAHGLSDDSLLRMVRGDFVGAEDREAYRRLIEELMAEAERSYDFAFRAIPTLPPFFQRPVAVAAHLYRGIHAEIRRSDYDNLGRRAHTSTFRKISLASRSLFELRRLRTSREARRNAVRPPARAPALAGPLVPSLDGRAKRPPARIPLPRSSRAAGADGAEG